jgi:hypothetical protein
MSILTSYRSSSPENPLTSFGDLFRLRSVKPLFDLRDRLKIMSGWGAQHRGRRQSPAPASDQQQLEHALSTLGIDDLMAMEIPERELLLDPILPVKGLMMIHARRGGSKTFLALAIGLAVASGTCLLRWSAPKARRVLYIDGEMTLIDLQKRVAALKAGMGVDIRNDHFRLLAADHTDVPDLATEAGQQALDPLLDGVDLLIVDNISTLCWASGDNSAGSWTPMQEWILRLRKRGLAVLLVHHSCKSGEQRGTSRREDVLDTVIGLRRSEDYEPRQGARFEVHVEKSRAHSRRQDQNRSISRRTQAGEGQAGKFELRTLTGVLRQNATARLVAEKGHKLERLGLVLLPVRPYIRAMLFDLQLLGKPDAAGNADVIENRTLAAASIEEAVRTAKDIVLNTPVPGIYGFRLMRNGLEVFHWFIGQDDA